MNRPDGIALILAAAASPIVQVLSLPAVGVRNMQLKCPETLLLQRIERPSFSLEDLLAGGGGVVNRHDWLALAPHLSQEVPLEYPDLEVFDAVSSRTTVSRDVLASRFGSSRIDRLVDAGLLIGDHSEHDEVRRHETLLNETGWWAPAAVAHRFGRWQGVDVAADEARNGKRSLARLLEENGDPPPECLELRPRIDWRKLPTPAKSDLDELLACRATCRNFDGGFALPLDEVSVVLHRVFGAQATKMLAPGAVALKKNSPSGGGLHPIEAFVMINRVAGLAPGLYHYQPVAHALEPMRSLSVIEASVLAHELVAGQAWFANAPVLILMAARFQRNFWKYRNHAKAWRVIQLDAGHLSQNLYLSATELGYGAFVTGAINDECAERLFELDGLSTGAVAVCGFGRRADTIVTTEFDPLGKAVR